MLGSYSREEGRHSFLYKCRIVVEGFFFSVEVGAMNMLKHYVHPSIVSGREPVQIALIGAGGTGSQLLSGLATNEPGPESPGKFRP